MKSLLGKFAALTLLAAVGGSVAVGCSSEIERRSPDAKPSVADGDSGSVRLHLVPVSGITINEVDYEVTGNLAIPSPPGPPLPAGTLPTPGTADNFSFGIPVPVGTGYVLSLSAESAEEGDDIRCTGSSAPFDVAALSVVDFTITLTCVDYTNGQVVATVDVVSEDCPRLIPKYATAIPASQDVGAAIQTNALAQDLDGKAVTYSWSIAAANSSVGSFANPNLQAATFNCLGEGQEVPLTVTFDNGECDKTLETWISCNSLTCGNGVLDPGESCDKAIAPGEPGGSPAGTTYGCPSDCTVACNDAVVEAPTEQCNSGGMDTDTCTADCRTRAPSCGDGFLTPPELCDGTKFPAGTPAGSSCINNCTEIAAPRCGDGAVGGVEECDPGENAMGMTVGNANCSNDCNFVASTECTTCEAGSACAPFATACLTSAGTPTAAEQAQCYNVAECIQDTGCADGANAFTSCFCGSLTTTQCSAAPETGAGSPMGPCAAAIRAGMGAGATNAEIVTRMTNRNFASGAAIFRFNCLKNNPVCRPLCGF